MSKKLGALERTSKYNVDDYTVCYQRQDYKLLQQVPTKPETIDNSNPSEALKELELVENWIRDRELKSSNVIEPSLSIIKQALLKAQENEIYVIYCVNNYHNVYMDYRGEPCNYSDATLFKDKFEAHQFLRNNHRNNYYIWAVVNNKDLSDEEKRRID